MERRTYPSTYPSPPNSVGGFSLSKLSFYPYYPQLNAEQAAESGLIQGIDGGGTVYPKILLPQVIFPGLPDLRESLKGTYSCDDCPKKFSQPQGVLRHRRKAHNKPHTCLCCKFEWTRPYQYRAHLEMRHRDVNPDEVLGKPAGSRRSSRIIGRDVPRHFYRPALNSADGVEPNSGNAQWRHPGSTLTPQAQGVLHLTALGD